MLVELNNRIFIKAVIKKFRPDRTLILLPHCLQWHKCENRLTFNIDACDRCGDCTVSGLLELRDRFGVEMKIVTGGTTARKAVREKTPEFILAVACPRDMASGILDSYPIPVYAQLNVLKCGECFDTWVNVENIEKTLEKYL